MNINDWINQNCRFAKKKKEWLVYCTMIEQRIVVEATDEEEARKKALSKIDPVILTGEIEEL